MNVRRKYRVLSFALAMACGGLVGLSSYVMAVSASWHIATTPWLLSLVVGSLTTLLFALGGLALLRLLQKEVFHPLDRLTHMMSELATGGSLSMPPPRQGPEVVEKMGRALVMLESRLQAVSSLELQLRAQRAKSAREERQALLAARRELTHGVQQLNRILQKVSDRAKTEGKTERKLP